MTESHVHPKLSNIAVMKGCSLNNLARYTLIMSTIHHQIGITVEIVGIEANSNGRSCFQHDVCGTLVEEDVVLRLRKVQILNSLGREETAIAAYHVSDGIDQCRVGFLQRQFVAHARTFDGVLAQVTEVYSVGSDSPINIRRCEMFSFNSHGETYP